jgi:hypothetical protein
MTLFGPALVLDRLAHAGQGLGAIAGEAAGRVDQVLVPGPARQADVGRQRLVDVCISACSFARRSRGQAGVLGSASS